MDLSGLRAEAKRLRSAEPSRAIRGFDEGETRTLLSDAAKLLEAAADEREKLQHKLERLRCEAGEEAAGKEAIGNALLAATRAAEEMAAEARASAERITAEAEARAATVRAAIDEESAATRAELDRERELLEREQGSWRQGVEREQARALEEARVQADTMVADARLEVERLQTYAQRLRALLIDSQRALVELAEAAVGQLDDANALKIGSGQEELLDDLRPSELDERPSPSAAVGDLRPNKSRAE
jgi:cell division septum initiation protein DivIVA